MNARCLRCLRTLTPTVRIYPLTHYIVTSVRAFFKIAAMITCDPNQQGETVRQVQHLVSRKRPV